MTDRSPNWRCQPLAEDDAARVRAIGWRAFSHEIAMAIAEGYAADVPCGAMAERLGIGPHSVGMAIGAMKQAGVIFAPKVGADIRNAERDIPKPRPVVAPGYLERLRRMAPTDDLARRSLALLQGEAAA